MDFVICVLDPFYIKGRWTRGGCLLLEIRIRSSDVEVGNRHGTSSRCLMSIYFSHVEYCRVMDVFFRALKLHKHLLIIIIIIIILYERASIFKSTSAVGVKV